MLLRETLRKIVEIQSGDICGLDPGTKRDILDSMDAASPLATIISGVRRCGKSTLLKQIMKKYDGFNYFNFEDERALNFEVSDFERLDEVFVEMNPGAKYYCFDEIQNVNGWERFVRRKVDEGKKFFITGSNSSLLGSELSTKLTGRHLTYELFPMSYAEALRLEGETASLASFSKYFSGSGFPGYIKHNSDMMLQRVFEDIVVKDIIVRYGLKDPLLVKNLAIYLMTNAGKEFSYNGLKKSFDLGTASTVSSFVSYFEDSYLLFTVPKFSYSYKKQLMNPKKAYAIDHGLARANSVSFSADNGRILENIVFLQLRRQYPSIYYFREKNECDFIARDRAGKLQAIQVCYRLDEDTLRREMKGLKEAMGVTGLKSGMIITFGQEDTFDDIDVVPAWKWLSGPDLPSRKLK